MAVSLLQAWMVLNTLFGFSLAMQGTFKDRSICVYQDECAIDQTCCCYECVNGSSCVGCTCDKSSACADGESCCNHLCVSLPNCVGQDCSLKEQCGTNEHCCNHKCELDCDSCLTDSDCDDTGDLICCNKKCTNSIDCGGSLCSTNSDCHGGDFDFYNCCGGWCKEIDCFDYTPLVIGIICGAVVIVVLGGFFYFRRRQRRLEASRQPLVAAAEAPDYGCLCIWFRRQ